MFFVFCVEYTNIRIKNELFSDKSHIVGEIGDWGLEGTSNRIIENWQNKIYSLPC
jgi:hypothetical protein